MSVLYTQKQAQALAKSVGFTDAQAEIAAAIAMAETNTFVSGVQYCNFSQIGDTTLANATWGPSYGAWQVRSLVADYDTGRTRDGLRLPEPTFNAKSALTIFKNAGSSWTPWSTYTSGAYKGFMLAAVYNPKPVIPAGTYMVSGGDTLSAIGTKTGYAWRLIAALNNLYYPFTIFPGQILVLPDWTYTVVSGDYLSKIASTYSEVTTKRIAEYNNLTNPDVLSVGQKLKIPRYTSWDGVTLVR